MVWDEKVISWSHSVMVVFVKAYVKTVEQDSVVIVSNAVEQLVAFSPDTSQTT